MKYAYVGRMQIRGRNTKNAAASNKQIMVHYLNDADKKPYAILADIDDTIAFKLPNRLLLYFLKIGILSETTKTKAAEILKEYEAGKIDNETLGQKVLALCLADFAGQKYDSMVGLTKEFLKGNMDVFYPYFANLVDLCRLSHDVYLITSNCDFVPHAVCEAFSLKGFAGSASELVNGIFTGQNAGLILSRADKSRESGQIMAGYKKDKSIGLGDSEPDLGILEAVGIPIAIYQESRDVSSVFKNAIPHSQVIDFIKTKL